MTKKHLCSLYFYEHRKHPIIARQIPAFLASGKFEVTVLDRAQDDGKVDDLQYGHVRVGTANLTLFSRWVWWFLRKVLPDRAAHGYWVVLSFAQMFVTAARFIPPALRCKADLYAAHDVETLMAAVMVAKMRRKPVVYDAHELQSEQFALRSVHNRVIRWLEHRLIPGVDLLIVPNQMRKVYHLDRFHLHAEPLVILNCAPHADWPKSDKLAQRLHLPPGCRTVIYHGSYLIGRALEALVQSAADFDEGIVLVMIGEQNAFYRDVLEPLCRKHALTGKVLFLPHMRFREVMSYVASADLGVVIYKNTTLNNYYCAPTKLYEYVMARVPFIGSNFPEIERFLAGHPVGLTFDPDSAQSIAATVNRFFAFSPCERQAVADNLQAARQRYTWEIESTKLINALGALA